LRDEEDGVCGIDAGQLSDPTDGGAPSIESSVNSSPASFVIKDEDS
jgi:hypothetical protein